jgi:hypothetical protein
MYTRPAKVGLGVSIRYMVCIVQGDTLESMVRQVVGKYGGDQFLAWNFDQTYVYALVQAAARVLFLTDACTCSLTFSQPYKLFFVPTERQPVCGSAGARRAAGP